MGPFLIFDKSFLQSLSLDEAAILDQLFSCIVTPLFFAETLGTLAKESRKRPPEAVVRSLADKTPVVHSYINAFHTRLALGELLGMEVEMRGRPAMPGGIPVVSEDGPGLVFKKSPEMEAFGRWQRGRFSDVDRIVAGAWRDHLGQLDLPDIAAAFKKAMAKESLPKNHEQARVLARKLVDARGQNYWTLKTAYALLGFPMASFGEVLKRWKQSGRPTFREFAPYTARCLEIDLYFFLSLANGLISDQRASNKIDIGYLYYLPFARIFVSGDRLHREASKHFLENNQVFVWGPDLKKDLCVLNEVLLALPQSAKDKGLFKLLSAPPLDHQGPVTELWDKLVPKWREDKPVPVPTDPEFGKRIIGQGNRLVEAARGKKPGVYPPNFPASDTPDRVVIERHIPRQRGSWAMFPDDFE